jgi:exopolysaccharide biosynthesis polyprenyl glycosylphosphotransferase
VDLSIDARRRVLLGCFQLWDVALIVALLAGAWALAQGESAALTAADPRTWRLALWWLGSAAIWHAVFASFDLYASRRICRRAGEARDLLGAVALGVALAGGLGALLRVPGLSLAQLATVWLAATLGVLGYRRLLALLLARVRRSGRNLRNLLVVGGGALAQRIARELLEQADLGYQIIGYVSDDASAGSPGRAPQLGGLAEFDRILAQNVVDEVIVALPFKANYDHIERVILACERQGIGVSLPLEFFGGERAQPRLDVMEQLPLLRYGVHRVTGSRALLKRGFDVLVSLLLLLALAPLFALIAIGVKLSSRGPVFFVQERVGLRKRTFRLYKFRTMVPDAEARLEQLLHLNEAEGPVFKVRNDPRLVPLGALLRRTSLDELPQLWNVLKGDMSLVGPRPLPLRDVRGFPENALRRRFSVKPGITCVWQVSGRSDLGFEKWMELDLRYIEDWSFALDMKILLRTLPAVLRGTGAR